MAKMYIGPTRPFNLLLSNNTIIIDLKGVHGLPQAIQDHPILKDLIVDVKDLAEARQQVRKKGSKLYIAYQTVVNETIRLREEGK